MNIRPADRSDLEAITEIYNDAIANTTSTFELDPRTLEEQVQWFNQHDESHPILIARNTDAFIGWASISPWSRKSGYKTTVELSIYIDHSYRGMGTGTLLGKHIINEARQFQYHSIISRIADGNAPSIALHEKLDFQVAGVLKEAGYKFQKFIDVFLYQLIL